MAFIEFHNVNKYFGDNHVLRDINLSIEQGQLVTLLGPSGCGKSTLLRCLSGLETLSSGNIMIDGKDVTNVPPKDRGIGMVFQHYSLFPNMTVAENIAFGLKLKKTPKEEIRERVQKMLQIVELEGKEDEYPDSLSGGQQQRVALARSIVLEPKVLLLDEPLSAIDAKLRKFLQKSIRDIQRQLNLTAVFVTHDQDEAMVMSDSIALFHDGKIEQSCSPVTMYTDPVSRFAAAFIGNYNILDAEQFCRLTNGKTVRGGKEGVVAVRPETISFLQSGEPGEDYIFEGIVEDNLPRGNVLQYQVNVNGILLRVDVLFRSKVLFEKGMKVRLTLADHNCIRL